jgi:hypothetical protein
MKLVETYKNSSEWEIDCCFTPSEQIFGLPSFLLSTQYEEGRTKTGCLGIRIMCQCTATSLPVSIYSDNQWFTTLETCTLTITTLMPFFQREINIFTKDLQVYLCQCTATCLPVSMYSDMSTRVNVQRQVYLCQCTATCLPVDCCFRELAS